MDTLGRYRMFELEQAAHWLARIGPGGSILELGAGSGHQAAALAAAGFGVVAIDLETTPYREAQVFPVAVYDGRRLPFPDESFDAVFSSNVLEHVQDLDVLLREIHRVLRPGGLSLHLMPTSAWRFWSLVTHFGWGLKRMLALAGGSAAAQAELGRPRQPSTLGGAMASLLPHRHGEHGTALGELYSFRRRRWLQALGAGGLHHVADQPTGLFYTNALLFGGRIPMRARQAIAKMAGSACRIYCFQKTPGPLAQ